MSGKIGLTAISDLARGLPAIRTIVKTEDEDGTVDGANEDEELLVVSVEVEGGAGVHGEAIGVGSSPDEHRASRETTTRNSVLHDLTENVEFVVVSPTKVGDVELETLRKTDSGEEGDLLLVVGVVVAGDENGVGCDGAGAAGIVGNGPARNKSAGALLSDDTRETSGTGIGESDTRSGAEKVRKSGTSGLDAAVVIDVAPSSDASIIQAETSSEALVTSLTDGLGLLTSGGSAPLAIGSTGTRGSDVAIHSEVSRGHGGEDTVLNVPVGRSMDEANKLVESACGGTGVDTRLRSRGLDGVGAVGAEFGRDQNGGRTSDHVEMGGSSDFTSIGVDALVVLRESKVIGNGPGSSVDLVGPVTNGTGSKTMLTNSIAENTQIGSERRAIPLIGSEADLGILFEVFQSNKAQGIRLIKVVANNGNRTRT